LLLLDGGVGTLAAKQPPIAHAHRRHHPIAVAFFDEIEKVERMCARHR
jgi:hypothetical protein